MLRRRKHFLFKNISGVFIILCSLNSDWSFVLPLLVPFLSPPFHVLHVSRTFPSFSPAETLYYCKWNLLTLNTTRVHLELSDTHDTFILSLKHLKQKIIKVYCHTFYITDKFFFRTIEITMKTLELPKQYVHWTFVCSFKIVYSFIPTLGKSLCIFFRKKGQVYYRCSG